MKLVFRLLILAAVLAVAAAAGFYRFWTSRQQAFDGYVAELRKHGEKVTFQELTASYSPSTNHSFARLSNIVARLGPAPGEICNSSLVHFVPPDRAKVAWSLDQSPKFVWKGKTNESWNDLRQQIEAAASELGSLEYVLRDPDPNIGSRTNWFDLPTMWPQQKEAANWLGFATLLKLHDARRSDALSSLQALTGLARLHREEAVLVIQMTRAAVAQGGIDLTWEALQLGNWTEHQLLTLQQSWESLDFLAGLRTAMEGERSMPVEMILMMREPPGNPHWPRGEANPDTPASPCLHRPLALLHNDTLYALRHQQANVEFARQINEGRAFNLVMKSFGVKQAALEAKSRSITRICYAFSLIAIPNYAKAYESVARIEMRRRLAVVAIALKRYELQHGQSPATLAALVPKFLRAIPRDCMNAQPLHYRLNNDGTYHLYSVGLDGHDDGGDPTPIQPALWNGRRDGRDLVWPQALSTRTPQ